MRVPADIIGQNEVIIYYKTDGNAAVKGFQAAFTTTFIGEFKLNHNCTITRWASQTFSFA